MTRDRDQGVTRAATEGWAVGGSFFASVLSGTLLGYLADRWLGTGPWLVAAGILLGAYSGFMVLWNYAKERDDPRTR